MIVARCNDDGVSGFDIELDDDGVLRTYHWHCEYSGMEVNETTDKEIDMAVNYPYCSVTPPGIPSDLYTRAISDWEDWLLGRCKDDPPSWWVGWEEEAEEPYVPTLEEAKNWLDHAIKNTHECEKDFYVIRAFHKRRLKAIEDIKSGKVPNWPLECDYMSWKRPEDRMSMLHQLQKSYYNHNYKHAFARWKCAIRLRNERQKLYNDLLKKKMENGTHKP